MTTMRCPQCGQPVRFEGKSGLCPKCMTVVNAPGTGGKAGSAGGPAGPSKGRVKSRSSGAADLDGLARDAEVFAPPSATGQTSHGGGLSSLDPRLLYGGGAAILLVVLFGLFEVLYTPTTSVVVSTPQPFAYPAHASVAAPPEEKAAVRPPPPVVPPPTAVVAGAPVLAVPRWYGLRPTVPLLPADTINDALVERALTRAVAYLKPMVAAADLPHTADGSQWLAGGDGLVTYALLHTGEAIEDPDLSTSSPLMSAALDRLKAAPPDKTYATYLHSVRAQALALADREADHDQLASDQRWLLKAERDGAYSYTSAAEPGWVQWDHSNSQYGVLGVWAASEAGVPAPAAYWQDVERHWVQTQNTDGGWPYSTSRESTAPMTAAGVTTLCVAAEQEVLIIDGRDAAAEHRSPKAATNHPTPAGTRGTPSTGWSAPPWRRASVTSGRTTGTARWAPSNWPASRRTGPGRATSARRSRPPSDCCSWPAVASPC